MSFVFLAMEMDACFGYRNNKIGEVNLYTSLRSLCLRGKNNHRGHGEHRGSWRKSSGNRGDSGLSLKFF